MSNTAAAQPSQNPEVPQHPQAPGRREKSAVPVPGPGGIGLKKDGAGLVPAVIQQYDSKEVLMLGWMDDEALHRTLTTGRVTFFSRSRQEYWRKGDTSGAIQWVKAVSLDCDADTLLVQVDQVGAACHTGSRTCFDGRDLGAVVGPSEGTA